METRRSGCLVTIRPDRADPDGARLFGRDRAAAIHHVQGETVLPEIPRPLAAPSPPEKTEKMYKSILVAIDLNDETSALRVTEVAIRLARDNDAALHIVNVIPDFGMSFVNTFFTEDQTRKIVEDEKARFESWARQEMPEGQAYDLTVVKGHVYDNILRTADRIGADVIVLGSHKPELEDYLLGPNAARVVRHAKQSVFVVRN